MTAEADRFARDLVPVVARDLAEGAAVIRMLAEAVLVPGAMARPASAAEAAVVEALVAQARRMLATRSTVN